MATTDDFAVYMDVDPSALNTARAQMMIDQATSLATAVINPLPAGADAVLLSAAARAYANPTGATSESIGGYSVQRPWPGVYLTKSEKRTLRTLAGQAAGAFTVDPTPADAMVDYYDPLEWPTGEDIEQWDIDTGLV